ncbi:hypothetical protein NDU88_003844 [Pleurodeles waltl]|uniref:Uncharacterized protein n=1 Tax=Pleurodeles waltl TaxID=8319 RepID=A0AAV7T6F5_PLEWA|nr:hypothetical protein NDU88_003844 [Pleurodeles waltl]
MALDGAIRPALPALRGKKPRRPDSAGVGGKWRMGDNEKEGRKTTRKTEAHLKERLVEEESNDDDFVSQLLRNRPPPYAAHESDPSTSADPTAPTQFNGTSEANHTSAFEATTVLTAIEKFGLDEKYLHEGTNAQGELSSNVFYCLLRAWLGHRARWPSPCEALPGPGTLSANIHPNRGGEGADPWRFPPGGLPALFGPGLTAAQVREAGERREAWRRLISARAGF